MRWPWLVLALVSVPCFGAELYDLAWGVDAYGLDAIPGLAPSWAHPLGTDALGRDQLARLLHGGRVSLIVASLGAALAFVIGASVGLVAGWFGGWVEALLMRFTEAVMALPKLPLMLILAGVDLPRAIGLRPGPLTEVASLVLIIGLMSWPDVARLTRAATRSLRGRAFIMAAEGLGMTTLATLRLHVVPHLAAPLGVALALDLGENVLYESFLSFLGLGVSPPTPSWGTLLGGAFARLREAPWMIVVPGLLTFGVVASAHGLAEALRVRLDPATARSEVGRGGAP